MYLADHWTFLVELAGDPPLASKGLCLVDLSMEDDRGDVEPYVDAKDQTLNCTLGVRDHDNHETRRITQIWQYDESRYHSFNEKFPFFAPVSMVDFVRCVCDAAKFDDYTEKDILELKKNYGVLR